MVTADEIMPLVVNGRCVSGVWAKSEAFADFFANKWSVKSERQELGAGLRAEENMGLLLPFREVITQSFVLVTRVEVEKAIAGLALGRAPGLDRLPAVIFRRILAIAEMLVLLFNAILRGGRLPVTLTRNVLVLLLRPGKDLGGSLV